MEDLLARHRKEQKELQAKVTSKKKNASKKTRKGVNDECDRLESDLKQKQQQEIDALNGEGLNTESLSQSTAALTVDDSRANEPGHSDSAKQVMTSNSNGFAGSNIPQSLPVQSDTRESTQSRKPNRQKARLARRAAEQEAAIQEAESAAALLPDQRKIELEAMKQQLEKRGLQETLIRPDGHCLYSACALSISREQAGSKVSTYQDIRRQAAEFMQGHRADYEVFMDDDFDTYTHRVADTAEWGGHLELSAIAKAYKTKINVLQASGQVEVLHPEDSVKEAPDIWLAYYKHSFGLGEHYNALSKIE